MTRSLTLAEILPFFEQLPEDRRLPHPIVVLDTETTGLPPKPSALDPDKRGSEFASVCEIGAVLLDTDGMPLDLLHVLICPDRWPEEPGLSKALAVSGLTRETLEREGFGLHHARSILRAWWPMFSTSGNPGHGFDCERIVFGACKRGGPVPWVAFNTDFDRRMLERTFEQNGDARLPPACGCVMLAAKDAMAPLNLLNPSPEWAQKRGDMWQHPKASAAMDAFRVPREHKHFALSDAVDEALILCAMARDGLPPWSDHAR